MNDGWFMRMVNRLIVHVSKAKDGTGKMGCPWCEFSIIYADLCERTKAMDVVRQHVRQEHVDEV